MKTLGGLLVLFLAAQGCGSGVKGVRLRPADADAVFTLDDAPPGYATMFVYREARAATAYGLMRVLIDGVKVYELSNGSFTKLHLKPGKHHFKLRFYDGESMAQDLGDREITADKPWLLMSDYFGKTQKLTPLTLSQAKAMLAKRHYQAPPAAAVDTITVTEEDHSLWNDFKGKNSVTAMDNFLYLYPRSPYAKDAKERRETLVRNEKQAFAQATGGSGAVLKYLASYPQAHNKEQALKEAIRRGRSVQEMRAIYAAHPEAAALMPAEYRMEFELMECGPAGMKVSAIRDLLVKDKLSSGIVSAKIVAQAGIYKDFSVPEIKHLQSLGIPESVIEAMITSTSKAQEQVKQAEKDEAMMKKIAELIANAQKQVDTATVQADGGSSTIECIKQKTALEACARTTSGFLKIACDAAARSSFPCAAY